MAEIIKQGWHRVLVALMNDDAAQADRERARVERLAQIQRSIAETRRILAQVPR